MTREQYILIACVVGAVASIGFWLSKLLMGDPGDAKLRDRLTSAGTNETLSSDLSEKPAIRTGGNIFQTIGSAAAEPLMPKSREKQSVLRRRLALAGIYSPSASRILTGWQMIFIVLGLVGSYLVGSALADPGSINIVMLVTSVGGLIGYMLPRIWLNHAVSTHRRELSYGLPDALDLMVVCVEAGLTVDAAMQRVGQELGIAHPRLSREFAICHMETRVGVSRADAMKNMGQRTGSPPLQSLASMLVQAERFGTGIASALRIHAEGLRLARQNAAEEMAAKASVKLSFPLVLFIFPATFIVVAGPIAIQLVKSSLFAN